MASRGMLHDLDPSYVIFHSTWQRRWGGDVRDVLGRPWCRTVNDVGLLIDTKILQNSLKNNEYMIEYKRNGLFVIHVMYEN